MQTKINITRAILPSGCEVTLEGNDESKSAITSVTKNRRGKDYIVSIQVQFDTATGIPYSAYKIGGSKKAPTLFKSIKLSRIKFYDENGALISVSNTGRLKQVI